MFTNFISMDKTVLNHFQYNFCNVHTLYFYGENSVN